MTTPETKKPLNLATVLTALLGDTTEKATITVGTDRRIKIEAGGVSVTAEADNVIAEIGGVEVTFDAGKAEVEYSNGAIIAYKPIVDAPPAKKVAAERSSGNRGSGSARNTRLARDVG